MLGPLRAVACQQKASASRWQTSLWPRAPNPESSQPPRLSWLAAAQLGRWLSTPESSRSGPACP